MAVLNILAVVMAYRVDVVVEVLDILAVDILVGVKLAAHKKRLNVPGH
jgi:hypothetical protein